MIVAALSDDWGIVPTEQGGTAVWFTMRLP